MGHVIGIDTTYTGNPVSFNAVNGGTMKSVSVPFSATQDLHGYSKPWPAGGGKNILPYPYKDGTSITRSGITFTVNSDGSITCVGTATASAYFYCYGGSTTSVPDWIKPSTTYAVSSGNGAFNTSVPKIQMIFYGSPSVSVTDNVITTPADLSSYTGFAVVIIVTNGNTVNKTVYPQIEAGNAPTAHATYSNICPITGFTELSVYVSPTQDPDDATTYNVDWSTQAGTVYGGTLDVVTGELTVDYVKRTVTSVSLWNASNPNGTPVYAAFSGTANTIAGIDASMMKSNIFTYSSLTRFSAPLYAYGCIDGGTTTQTFILPSSITTKAEADAWFAANPTECIFKLATPLTYQLTPKQITALIGQNYIWSSNNETLTAVLTAPATGFAGWLIKCVTNGTPVEIPLKYMRAETYTVTPDQRMEWSAERDVTGVLHRETVQNLPPKIEFNTPLMTNSDINALNSIIKAAFTNYLQRNITIQFYDPERNQYWEWDCYMPDVKYHIRNADTVNNTINYEELRYAFIGY